MYLQQLLPRLSEPPSCPDYLSEPPCSSGSRSVVMGRWGFWAPLRDCPSPQKSMMKAHMLIGALVMVGFTVGKGKWGRGREGGVAEYRERVVVGERDVAG